MANLDDYKRQHSTANKILGNSEKKNAGQPKNVSGIHTSLVSDGMRVKRIPSDTKGRKQPEINLSFKGESDDENEDPSVHLNPHGN